MKYCAANLIFFAVNFNAGFKADWPLWFALQLLTTFQSLWLLLKSKPEDIIFGHMECMIWLKINVVMQPITWNMQDIKNELLINVNTPFNSEK